MSDRAHLVDLIERSIEDRPYCDACHAPTTIRDRGGRLWLECSATPADEPSGLVARLGAALVPHPRHLVVDLNEEVAA
jgi:hypothetical protein